jgi:O-antigen ligase
LIDIRHRQISVLQPYFNYKTAIIMVQLAMALVIGSIATSTILLLLILAFGGVVAFFVLHRHPEWGLLAIIPVTFLVPITVGTGTNVSLNATILFVAFLFAVWLVRMFLFQKDVRLAATRLNTPVLLFILATTVSLAFGNTPLILLATQKASVPAQLGGWMILVFSIGMLLLGANSLHFTWLKAFVWSFLAFGAVYTFFCILYSDAGANQLFFQEGISSAIFWIFLAVLGFGQLFFNKELSLKWRLLAVGISVAGLVFGWVRGKEWLAGWLPPLIGVYILVWLRSWKLALLVTVIGAVVLIPAFPELYAKVYTPDQEWSTYTRWLTWSMMSQIVKASPIFGVGPANPYHYSRLFSYGGYFLKLNSHNNYWDIATQTGLVGLVLFIWIVIELAVLGFRLRKQLTDGFSQSYVNSVLAGFAAMLASGMMADWFLPYLYNIGIPGFRSSVLAWLFLGGLLSMDVIQRNANKPMGQDVEQTLENQTGYQYFDRQHQ